MAVAVTVTVVPAPACACGNCLSLKNPGLSHTMTLTAPLSNYRELLPVRHRRRQGRRAGAGIQTDVEQGTATHYRHQPAKNQRTFKCLRAD